MSDNELPKNLYQVMYWPNREHPSASCNNWHVDERGVCHLHFSNMMERCFATITSIGLLAVRRGDQKFVVDAGLKEFGTYHEGWFSSYEKAEQEMDRVMPSRKFSHNPYRW